MTALGGCAASVQSVLDVSRLESSQALPSVAGTGAGQLNPHYRYLRVTVNGRPALMILGFVDGPPGHTTEVWYSAAHEVLRLRDGLVLGTAGLPVNWVDVAYSAWPDWAALAATSASHPPSSLQASAAAGMTLKRERDVLPGYRFGLSDTLALTPIAPPAHTQLMGIDPASLHWFALRNMHASSHAVGFYAVRTLRQSNGSTQAQVVYGEQCLSAQLCLTWQSWPVAPRS